MVTGFITGSFDPPTFGHISLIKRSLLICDRLYIGVGTHPKKKLLLSKEARVHLLEKLVGSPNISILETFSELNFLVAC